MSKTSLSAVSFQIKSNKRYREDAKEEKQSGMTLKATFSISTNKVYDTRIEGIIRIIRTRLLVS